MNLPKQRYPIGIQTFSKIREDNYLYIDKTSYIYNMTHSESSYIFLSRPRRFGKSLLTSTLHCYFEGRKELFKGLAIERLETEWESYPVLHFDMSLGKHLDKAALERYLSNSLGIYERQYGIKTDFPDTNIRLANLIRTAYEKTGKKVVVLIDEYDAPLLDVVHEGKHLEDLRYVVRNFYSPLKGCDPYLRFVFLTGITKFSQLSIFSELNNIKNISMLPAYAAVCGITEEEMEECMQPGIRHLADSLQVTYEEAVQRLKDNYDGYHFTMPSPDIYNPFSLLNALSDGMLESYWFGSGTPTYLVEMMKKFHVIPQEIGGMEVLASAFGAPTEKMDTIVPLLYQSGYVTIKDYDSSLRLYTLDIPNREVRYGLMESLLTQFVGRTRDSALVAVNKMAVDMQHDNIDSALSRIQAYLATVPYTDNINFEGHWQQLLYILFDMACGFVDIEVRTPKGRVDMVIRTSTHLYVMELKLDKDAETAMRQINLKDYPRRFALCGLPVVKVGVNFDRKNHTISDWKINNAD